MSTRTFTPIADNRGHTPHSLISRSRPDSDVIARIGKSGFLLCSNSPTGSSTSLRSYWPPGEHVTRPPIATTFQLAHGMLVPFSSRPLSTRSQARVQNGSSSLLETTQIASIVVAPGAWRWPRFFYQNFCECPRLLQSLITVVTPQVLSVNHLPIPSPDSDMIGEDQEIWVPFAHLRVTPDNTSQVGSCPPLNYPLPNVPLTHPTAL